MLMTGGTMNEIVSRDNQWVKMACSLKQKKGRQAHQRVFVEGLRVIGDAAVMGITDAICFVSPKGRDLSGFEVREAQKSLLDAEERILSAEYNTKLCEISLLQISGKITKYLEQ